MKSKFKTFDPKVARRQARVIIGHFKATLKAQ